MSEDFETMLYPTKCDISEHLNAQVKLRTPIRNRVILILSAVITTRVSIKIGFGLINEQPDCLRILKLCSTPLNEVILNILLPEFSS